MSARKKNDTLADLLALVSRTGLIFYMIPPTKTEGEVDQRRLRGGRLSQLSSDLCSAVELHWRSPEAGWQQMEF